MHVSRGVGGKDPMLVLDDAPIGAAAKFAARVQQGEPDEARQVERAFLALYARPPQPDELKLATDYLTTFRAKLAAKKLPTDQAWPSLSRALLGANEFLYVD